MRTRSRTRVERCPILLGIPQELQIHFLGFLPVQCSARLARTCQAFRNLWTSEDGLEHMLRSARSLFPNDDELNCLTLEAGDCEYTPGPANARLYRRLRPAQDTIRRYGGIAKVLAVVRAHSGSARILAPAFELCAVLLLENAASLSVFADGVATPDPKLDPKSSVYRNQ